MPRGGTCTYDGQGDELRRLIQEKGVDEVRSMMKLPKTPEEQLAFQKFNHEQVTRMRVMQGLEERPDFQTDERAQEQIVSVAGEVIKRQEGSQWPSSPVIVSSERDTNHARSDQHSLCSE